MTSQEDSGVIVKLMVNLDDSIEIMSTKDFELDDTDFTELFRARIEEKEIKEYFSNIISLLPGN